MPDVRYLRKRGHRIVVEAHGEVLFAPGADIDNFKRRLSARVREATINAAPVNKRPRWGHYGKPLKTTFSAHTKTIITKGGGRFYITVGSSAPYAYYVDQGTGIYAGGAPYEAKVLPPWTRGSASLYEHTWRPGGPPNPQVAPVLIRGQRGQFFFDAGLKRGFESMRLRSYQIPGEGITGLAGVLASFPEGLANFAGNTPADGVFRASLEEWRLWRDTAFKAGRVIGRHEGAGTAEENRRSLARHAARTRRRRAGEAKRVSRAERSKVRSQVRRDRIKAMNAVKDITKPSRAGAGEKAKIARRNDRAKFLSAMLKKYGAGNVDKASLTFRDGYWYVLVRRRDDRGRPFFTEVRAKAKA